MNGAGGLEPNDFAATSVPATCLVRLMLPGRAAAGRRSRRARQRSASLEVGYMGMISRRRKVRPVFEQLRRQGVKDGALGKIYRTDRVQYWGDSSFEISKSVLPEIPRSSEKKRAREFAKHEGLIKPRRLSGAGE
jgi:hypothetical protein